MQMVSLPLETETNGNKLMGLTLRERACHSLGAQAIHEDARAGSSFSRLSCVPGTAG